MAEMNPDPVHRRVRQADSRGHSFRNLPWLAALGLGFVLSSCTSVPKDHQTPADFKIVSRADWGANPPVAAMKSHTPSRITIHHTAVLQKPDRSLADKLQALQKFSQNEGTLGNGKAKLAWPDVPYHFYIDCHGGVAEGRDVNAVGDTNTEYDPTGHALVVLEGNFEEEPVTDAQWRALVQTVSWLARRYDVAPAAVQGHQDYAQTLCPGKNLEAQLPRLRASLAGQE